MQQLNETLNNEHDKGYKTLLKNKKTFLEFLKDFVRKDWVNEIYEENLILIDKEFILRDFKDKESDLVYKANINGNEIIFYILLELQSSVDYSMPIRLFMYMSEIWRNEINNTDEKEFKSKNYKLPSIVPIVIYNGKNNWTVAKSFKEVLNGYELFEENIVDFKYLLFDVNRMSVNTLLDELTVISSVFSLDQSDLSDEEIVRRLKVIGRFLDKKATKDQLITFKDWITGILKNRYSEDASLEITDIISEISDMEVEKMVSNLGKSLENSMNKKYEKGIDSSITILKLLKENKNISEIAKITGVKEDKIKEIANLLLNQ